MKVDWDNEDEQFDYWFNNPIEFCLIVLIEMYWVLWTVIAFIIHFCYGFIHSIFYYRRK